MKFVTRVAYAVIIDDQHVVCCFQTIKSVPTRDWGIYGVLQNETNSLNMFYIEVPDLDVCKDLCSDPRRS